MRIVFLSFVTIREIREPSRWLERTAFYNGILERLAVDNEIHSLEPIRCKGSLEHAGVKYHFNGGNGGLLNLRKVLHYIECLQADAVVVHGLTTPLQVFMLGRKLGKKLRLFVHHHGEKPPGFIKRWLQKKADRVTENYFFASAKLAESWHQKGLIGGAEKIVEVMEGSSHFKPGNTGLALRTGELRFLFVGRLNGNKDPLIIIRAFLRFHKKWPEVRLYMIYQTDELLSQISAILPSTDSPVVLVGKVSHSQLEQWYRSASFFVSASHYEGSGIALCEAMSCGCIPIVSNIPSFTSMTNGGRCGLTFEAGDEVGLCDALQQAALLDINLMRELVLKQFCDKLSFETISRTMQTHFASALD